MTETELAEAMRGVDHFLMPGQAYWLHQKALELPSGGRILEIGTYRGASSLAMALGCVGTDKRVYTVDCCADHLASAVDNWTQRKVGGCIRHHLFNSRQLDKPPFGWPLFDFAFIDGSHDFLDAARDVDNVRRMLKPGGRLALHDVTEGWPAVKVVWEQTANLFSNHEFCDSIASGTIP